MAIGLRRKQRLDARRAAQRVTRRTNGVAKQKERARREARIIAKIKAAPDGDYPPEVESWLSRRFGKPCSRLNAEEIASLIS